MGGGVSLPLSSLGGGGHATVVLLLVYAGAARASDFATDGWYDRHYNYPPVPSGLAAINNVFGQPCSASSNFNQFTWTAESTVYNVNFNQRLGGAPIPGWYAGNGGGSTNLYWDIKGTISNNHWGGLVHGGIYGYNCRYISGTTTWSTHAWGIAIDLNTLHEHQGHAHNHTIATAISSTFQNHGWYWGLAFNDAMHFQYATNY